MKSDQFPEPRLEEIIEFKDLRVDETPMSFPGSYLRVCDGYIGDAKITMIYIVGKIEALNDVRLMSNYLTSPKCIFSLSGNIVIDFQEMILPIGASLKGVRNTAVQIFPENFWVVEARSTFARLAYPAALHYITRNAEKRGEYHKFNTRRELANEFLRLFAPAPTSPLVM